MSQNLQLQKITPPKIRRIRHRRRLVVANGRFPSRQPALSNFLTREAARAIASPLRLNQALAIAAGGTTYGVGDEFLIVGGTFTEQGRGRVTAVAAGVVTAAYVFDPGVYTVTPGAGAATSGAGDDALTVDTTLTTVVVGVTDQEILDALQGVGTGTLNRNIADTFDIEVSGQYLRSPYNSSELYVNAGIPVV
jgi:hypothetical protein